MDDSGERQTFDTGAVRDAAAGKPRMELISPIFERRLANWLTRGAEKYADRNWEQGIPMDRTMASLRRHVRDYREGDRSEDHLAAIAANVMFLIHTEEMIERDLLPANLNDMPSYLAPDPINVTSLEA